MRGTGSSSGTFGMLQIHEEYRAGCTSRCLAAGEVCCCRVHHLSSSECTGTHKLGRCRTSVQLFTLCVHQLTLSNLGRVRTLCLLVRPTVSAICSGPAGALSTLPNNWTRCIERCTKLCFCYGSLIAVGYSNLHCFHGKCQPQFSCDFVQDSARNARFDGRYDVILWHMLYSLASTP